MLRRHEVLSIDDAAEAADLFIGMLFQRWHQQLFYVALPPPSEALFRAHAERVVTRFFAAYRSGAH
jgi:uncharacterized protein YcgL (UPF0745 family)